MSPSEWVRRAPALALLGLVACGGGGSAPPARVAVVIGPGARSEALRPIYQWGFATVDKLGGAGGRQLEPKYVQLADTAAAQEAQAVELVSDPDLVAVVGAFSYAMAPKLVAAKIPYLTPETADADVFRAFHEGGYVWRTLESDSTMLWFFLAEAKGRGEKAGQARTSVALITSTDAYGKTFFDWYGFHATELGLAAFPPVQYDQDAGSCEDAVADVLLRGVPDFLIAVPSGKDPVAQAACIVRTLKARGAGSKVMLADSARVPALLAALGPDAEGLSGYDDAPDPTGGFSEAFTRQTGKADPPEFAANALDAVMLVAYGLEQARGAGREALQVGLKAVVDGRGTPATWDQFAQTLQLIRAGQSPDIAGASGPLSFDKDVYTDPTATFFDRWVVEAGAFKVTHHVTTETESSPNVSSRSAVVRGLKALAPDMGTSGGGTPNLPPLGDNWALIVAASSSWRNYRHQADVLAHYQALRANGFDDDHIVLALTDDVAGAPENAAKGKQGQVINVASGPDVRAGALPDYTGRPLNAPQLMKVLAGEADPALPAVLHSTAADNVYLLIVGHGGVEGPYLGEDERSLSDTDPDAVLSPMLLAETVGRMKQQGKFRRMLIAVDACHAGTLAPTLEAQAVPDVVLLAAAGQAESSFSANYASALDVWTADQFAYGLHKRVASPQLSIADLFGALYNEVAGSHVQADNLRNFGDATQISLSEFVSRGPR